MSIWRKAILSLALSLCLQHNCLAKEEISLEDKIIGSTFKTLAKAFVALNDIGKLKKENIDKINKMDEDKFKKRYSQVYKVIKNLPDNLKSAFKISVQMSKEEVIKNMESLDKQKLYKVIDSIPDTFIASQFKRYLNDKKQELQKSNVVEQISKFWDKIMEKAKVARPAVQSLPKGGRGL